MGALAGKWEKNATGGLLRKKRVYCSRKISGPFTENPRPVHRKLTVLRGFLRFVSAWTVRIKAIEDEGGNAYDSGNIQTL